jgi:hypothetical protein
LKVLQAIASVSIGMATMEIMREYMPKMMRAALPVGGRASAIGTGMEGMASNLAEGSALVGIVLGIGWILLQIGFYIVGVVYLRKSEVRATFRG